MKGFLTHLIHEIFVGCEYPHEQSDKKDKKDNEGDHRPNSNVIDTSEEYFYT
jgi:hypothetical protein